MCLWIDNFFERFMEQRIQKLNNFKLHDMEDSLPFPIEPLPAAPITLPQKRVITTRIDSGVNSFHVLSPTRPVISDNSHNLQPYLMPSTSRTNPPSGLLTPVQQFIQNSRKSKNKEPKYILSQSDHPDPQSLLRTRTRKGCKL